MLDLGRSDFADPVERYINLPGLPVCRSSASRLSNSQHSKDNALVNCCVELRARVCPCAELDLWLQCHRAIIGT
jgi:hypothetical protein